MVLREKADNSSKEGKIATDTGSEINQNIRRSRIVRLDLKADKWVMEKLLAVLAEANKVFNYDLRNGVLEPGQVAIYPADSTGQYDWHLDIGPSNLGRKLSISIPLNSPEEYKGGELMFNYGQSVTQEQQCGSAIVFPSYVLHKVSPVTEGARYSLVSWAHGPLWR